MNEKTVLIIEDEEDAAELFAEMMRVSGFRVLKTSSGAPALAMMSNEKPDIVILDIMMPEIDGYTVNTRLQEKDETRSIPVIILTAKGQMRDLFALGTNIVAFMEKPFDPKGLRDKIRELLTVK